MFSHFRSSPYWTPTIRAITWFPVVMFFADHGFSYGTVHGRSMQPTFNPDSNMLWKDRVLLNKWAVTNHQFSRGEVVTLTSPTDPKCVLTKRIIALEGDTVQPLKRGSKPINVPKGHCWVEGDEAFHSRDSNSFGTVTYVLFPFSRFGPVDKRPLSKRVTVGFISGHDEDYL
ncbi:mitochondrial inner membrane protease subunit 2 [Lichtheimia corymbifera JMRC:FSU:9682]|uniref:Mitochondrial inner membrane protease subunit 2 n=1 Tax=Lichtheimia corymbifera JMRC:FSU:9682 TaxID=1263082 RepID=A0A068S792_9FUNG|nr:mitochondrial inner membrane protease subunit 2 [Lichtheimia corymbifera JMRC:FSU:9682]